MNEKRKKKEMNKKRKKAQIWIGWVLAAALESHPNTQMHKLFVDGKITIWTLTITSLLPKPNLGPNSMGIRKSSYSRR